MKKAMNVFKVPMERGRQANVEGDVLARWRRCAKSEYRKIQRQKRDQHDESIKEIWKENWMENCSIVPEPYSVPHAQTCVPQRADCTASAKATCYIGNESQSVPIYTINAVSPLPRMTTWVPINENVFVEDETELTNMPYINEEEFKSDGQFYRELNDSYDGKMHSDASSSTLDDAIFVELVHALTRNTSEETAEASNLGGSTVSNDNGEKEDQFPFPSLITFEAISAEFPGKGTPQELKEKYIELTDQQDPERAQECTANVSGNEAESTPQKRTMSPFHEMLCLRCFKYCCLLHVHQKGYIKANLQEQPIPEPRPATEPCDSACYIQMESAVEHTTLPIESKDGDDRDIQITVNNAPSAESSSSRVTAGMKNTYDTESDWSDEDQILFNSLYEVYLKNYCRIALRMLTKTCQQVYEYAQKQAVDFGIEEVRQEVTNPQRRKNKSSLWSLHQRKMKLRKDPTSETAHNYTPCDHEGPCDANCHCMETLNYCEKFCKCSSDCPNRYPGCQCKRQCNTKFCACFIALRECDPDLCKSCGADQIEPTENTCKNVCVQRKIHKQLKVAPSEIAGWGTFIKDGAQKGDLITEYCGEVISNIEAGRRGQVYDKRKCSYLFTLNKEFVVDGTRKGSIIRFANHSALQENCYVKILRVAGDHRIAIYAKRVLQPGEELLYNYNYGPNDRLSFLPIERKVNKKTETGK